MTAQPYESSLAPAARRVITDDLPGAATAGVIDVVTTALLDNPHRTGKLPRDDLEGIWTASRGTNGALCRIREGPREVVVLRVDHRRDASSSNPLLRASPGARQVRLTPMARRARQVVSPAQP